MAGEIKKLEELCVKFGGRLLKVTARQYSKLREDAAPVDQYRTFFDAPFTENDLGIHWPSRTILYSGDVHWCEVIHEMGHTFASKSNPRSCADEEEFFGWEYLLAKKVGDVSEWLDMNENYSTGDLELGQLSESELSKYFEKRIQQGQSLGIIDKDLKLWAYTRELKIDEIKEALIAGLEWTEHQRDAALSRVITSGAQFEERCTTEGFSKGYQSAVAAALNLLDGAVVSPLPPLGKR